MRYQLYIKCKNCRSELHQLCIKSHDKGYIAITCNCNCKEKNSATDKDSIPVSAALGQRHLEVTNENDLY